MVIEMDGLRMFIIRLKDNGAMMKYFYAQKLKCDYDSSAGEYCFYNEADYLAAMIMV